MSVKTFDVLDPKGKLKEREKPTCCFFHLRKRRMSNIMLKVTSSDVPAILGGVRCVCCKGKGQS